MPISPPKPCSHPGCGALVRDGAGYCPAHKRVRPGSFADRDRGSAADRGYGAAWVKLRRMIMTRDAGLCQPCQAAGRVTIAAQVDHIVPKARGGTDDPGNLQAICRQCHQAKTDREKNEGRHG